MHTIPRLKADPVVDADHPIIISVTAFSEILAMLQSSVSPADLGKGKVQAIKRLRTSWKKFHPEEGRLRLGDAKHAIERLMDEINAVSPTPDLRPRISTPLSIAAVIVNTGTENVEIDLEELQLRVLSEVGTLGLAECGRILDLVSVFQAWNAGKQVGIISD